MSSAANRYAYNLSQSGALVNYVGTDRVLPEQEPLAPALPPRPRHHDGKADPITSHNRRARLVDLVCARYDVTTEEVLSRARDARVASGRQLLAAMLYLGGDSCTEIGRFLGRDRSTILHSLHQVRIRPDLAARFAELQAAGLPRTLSLADGIAAALLPFDLPRTRQARAYIYVDLLGEERRRAYQDLWRYGGMLALAGNAAVLERVRGALTGHTRYGAVALLNRATADAGRMRARA